MLDLTPGTVSGLALRQNEVWSPETCLPASILIAEDDAPLARLVATSLRREGYLVETVGDGASAVEQILRSPPDLVLLDLMLPGKDGLTVCREVRDRFSGPILMVTARDADLDELLGFEVGADDYVRKPVHPRILLARIQALLRRTSPGDAPLQIGALWLSPQARAVRLGELPVALSTAEFDLLLYLAQNAGRTLSREELYRALRGISFNGRDRAIDQRVSKIRQKLRATAPGFSLLRTVHGQGYLLAVPD